MSWQAERRANKQAEAEIRRQDEQARARIYIDQMRTAAQIEREAEQARRDARDKAADKRRARWGAAWCGLRGWLGAHVVELLIYPIALLSFVLAAPAMAAYGKAVFASDLGALLPGITELGMWAFAIAVVIERRRHPDRSVWGLVMGVLVFGAVAFGINFTHGLITAWDHGVVMGVASIAGVVAHQLTLATAPKSGQERREARIERAAARKVARIRKAAVRNAVAEIDTDGTARLIYAPGRYTLTRWRGLETAIVPGLPMGESADWDRELADLLAVEGTARGGDEPLGRGGVSTADKPSPTQREEPSSTPADQHGKNQPTDGAKAIPSARKKSVRDHRKVFHELIRRGEIDPATASANEVAKAVGCRWALAKKLLIEEHRRGGDAR